MDEAKSVSAHNVPLGLINTGISCFINASIQILMACPKFVEIISCRQTYELHNIKCKENNTPAPCGFCNWHTFIKRYNTQSAPFVPSEVIACIDSNGTVPIKQEGDVMETIQHLLHSIFDALKISGDFRVPFETILATFQHSPITHIRCGALRTSKATVEHGLLCIHVPISNVNSIAEGLIYYLKEYPLLYDCFCGKQHIVARKTSFGDLPPYLIIQLNRYTATLEKISRNVFVNYNIKIPFTCGTEKNTAYYTIKAFTRHIGQTLGSGHYYCYVRNTNDDWFLCNDSSIDPVRYSDVASNEPFVLLYERKAV